MNAEKIIDCERTKLERWSKFQLKHVWKRRGVIFFLFLFLSLISLKFIENEPIWLSEVLKRALLVSMLIISLSKETIEDEMITSIRAKSFTLAFIFGVGFTLIQPLLEYVIISAILEPNPNNTFSYFDILFYMLMIQIMFFEILKKNR